MSERFNFSEAEVAAYCATRLRDGRRQGGEYRSPCTIHGSDHRKDSLSVKLSNGLWHCHACGEGGNLIQLEQRLSNCDFEESLANISKLIGRDLLPKWPFSFAPPEGVAQWSIRYLAEKILKMEERLNAKAVDLYDYRGNTTAHDGIPARQQVPMPKIRLATEKNGKTQKTFRWLTLTQKGGWRTPAKEHATPDLYLQHLWHQRGVTKLSIANGEKAANRARTEWGLVVTCLPGGEKVGRPAPQQYIDTLAQIPCNNIVVDNDDVGRSHSAHLGARLLQAGAAEVHLVELPGLPPKGDLFDFIMAGGSQQQFLAAAQAAPLADANYRPKEKARKTHPPSGHNGQCDTGNDAAGKKSENDDDGTPKQAGSVSPPDGIAPNFRLTPDGVYFDPPIDEDNAEELEPPIYICGHLEVVGCAADADGQRWSRIVRLQDCYGHQQTLPIPMELVSGEPAGYRKILADYGLIINPSRKAQDLLNHYVMRSIPKRFDRLTDQIGWHGRSYVLPDCVFHPERAEEEILYSGPRQHFYRTAGTLVAWQVHVSAKCKGNSRLVFAVSIGFAALLLKPLGKEGGGFHFVGFSSVGKTTAQVVAGSGIGGGQPGRKGCMESWRATSNALEGVAAAHNDNLLVLNEITEIEPREAEQTVYMLGNGAGKRRMKRDSTLRSAMAWDLLFLSSGEKKLSEHIAPIGKRTSAGAEVRLLNIPADTKSGKGLFECLHGANSARDFAEQLVDAATRYYGHAQRAFLRHFVSHYDAVVTDARAAMQKFVREELAKLTGASPEVGRALTRIALVVAAGEIATRLKITGWEEGEASSAGRVCFQAWLDQRGGTGSADMEAAVRQVRAHIEAHGQSRYQSTERQFYTKSGDEIREKIFNRAGYWIVNGNRDEGDEDKTENDDGRIYLILPETFRVEVCAGYNHLEVASELSRRGYLEGGNDRRHPYQKQKRIPESTNPLWFYWLRNTILEHESDSDTKPSE